MRIAILATGSRGDVEPYIALGMGLQGAGHAVRLVTHQNFEALVILHGLEFWPLAGNVQEIIQSREMCELLEKGKFLAATFRTSAILQRAALQWAREGLAACRGMDLLLGGIGGLYIGLSLAEKLGLPFLQAYLAPFTPTQAFPSFLFHGLPAWLGVTLNRLSHHYTRQIIWQGFRSADSLSRRKGLGVPAASFWGPYNSRRIQGLPVLYGFSPSVIPPPPDWDTDTHVTGYWFIDAAADWTPPAALMDFLQAGPPPVYIGFGSMSARKPAETADLVVQALRSINQRAILLSGWSGMHTADMPDSVFMIDSIPHSWLFPRVAAVVHHGGAGTTAAGLRAGVPSVVIPFFADQPFWGRHVARLGVGPEPVSRRQLTVERLAHAIQKAVTDQTMRQRAAGLGAKIQAEDGVGRAVAVVRRLAERMAA